MATINWSLRILCQESGKDLQTPKSAGNLSMSSTLVRWKIEFASIPTKSGKILISEEIYVKLLEEKNAKWHKAYKNQVNIKKSRKNLRQKKKE